MRVFIALTALFLVGAPLAHAGAWTPEDVRAALSGRHTVPTYEDWRAGGADARAALLSVALDPAGRTLHRSRAIAALGAFDDAEVQAALRGIALDEGARMIYRNIAVEALAQSAGEGAMEVLKVTVGAPRATMREASVRALAKVGNAEARDMIAASAEADAAREVRATAAKMLADE
ncbi:MAG: hypothetical protein KC466_14675 [Myxococcales bacterium]|nr:hypothetical protein [Myxococcales bacterium]